MSSLWDDLAEEAAATNVTPIREDMPEWAPYDEHVEPLMPLPGRLSFAEIKGKRAPLRRFIIDGWIVRGSAGLLSGLEGVGKSLLGQQMATCAAVGRPFLGMAIAHTNAVYISCEDDSQELWRRQEAINDALGISMEELDGRLELISWKGEIGNELATFDAGGRLIVQNRYRQLEAFCDEFKPGLVFLDNAAHFFPGNENARHDVAAFLGLIEQLSIRIDGSVMLLAHPNKAFSQGNTAGNEYSGSTGWSAHVRNRLFINYRASPEDGSPVDDDDRTLRKSKANYGKRGEEVHFRWHDWAFRTVDDIPEDNNVETRANAIASKDNDIFLKCLAERLRQKRPVSEQNTSRTFAPREFAKMPESKNIGAVRLEQAMDRLFRINAIERAFLWVDKGEGKPRFGLQEVRRKAANDAPPTSADLSADLQSEKKLGGKSNEIKPLTSEGRSAEKNQKIQQNQTADLSADLPPTSADTPSPLQGESRDDSPLGYGSPVDERDDDYAPIEWGDDE